MKIPMPSPKNTNYARLFVERCGMAMDAAAPKEPTRRPPKWLCDKVYAHVKSEFGEEAADDFWASLFGPPDDEPTEDDLKEGETYAGENVVREAVSKDGLPTYRSNRLPNNALASDAALKYAPGLASVKIGFP